MGSLALYVGTKVGSRVGLMVGLALGLGVGAENVRKLRNTAVSLRVAALLRVTVAPDRDTDTTTVPAAMPVPLTTAPGWTIPEVWVMFWTTILPAVSVPLAVTKVACWYVGANVGDEVGADEGDALGMGVGDNARYVGTNVGDAGGAMLGEAEGCGVGLSGTYVGTSVGDRVGALLGSELGCGVG